MQHMHKQSMQNRNLIGHQGPQSGYQDRVPSNLGGNYGNYEQNITPREELDHLEDQYNQPMGNHYPRHQPNPRVKTDTHSYAQPQQVQKPKKNPQGTFAPFESPMPWGVGTEDDRGYG
jgi:hypothetical protein